MSLDNIVGQLLGNGMAGQSRSRLEHLLGPRGLGGSGSGGLGQILGGLLGGSGGAMGSGTTGAGGLGDLASRAGEFLGNRQAGGMTGGQMGGLGALAGALLGGGGGAARGALGGSAMAVLGAMALSALQNRNRGASGVTSTAAAGEPSFTQADVEPMVTPQAQSLVVRAMISAAKADGQIDQSELDRIMGKIGSDGVSDEERREIADELARPLDLQGLVATVPDEKTAAQVYGASLLSIDADTDAEKEYLRQLAKGLGLDTAVVQRLHELSNAPMV